MMFNFVLMDGLWLRYEAGQWELETTREVKVLEDDVAEALIVKLADSETKAAYIALSMRGEI